jgi:hypothetical protein
VGGEICLSYTQDSGQAGQEQSNKVPIFSWNQNYPVFLEFKAFT